MNPTNSGGQRTLAIFGGSFNPPGLHHHSIAQLLSKHFDEVVIVPCGPRPDKAVTNDVAPIYRAAMADMTFGGMPRVRVELFDLERSTFTRNHELEHAYSSHGEVWHVVGTDLLQGGRDGKSLIQTVWQEGKRLWQEARFAVIERPGVPFDEADLPPNRRMFQIEEGGASSQVREAVYTSKPFRHLVTSRVAHYIERHGLYRGTQPTATTTWNRATDRFFHVVSERSERAKQISKELPSVEPDQAEMILVIGGDGTMLRAIRHHWRRRLPFYGLNAGHMGFLLNPNANAVTSGQELVLQQLPLLHVTFDAEDGNRRSALAFNDAWVERSSGQTAWLRVNVDGQVRIPELVADGALVATAAGSSAYARAMGATPLPLNTPAMLLVGSNVLKPSSWRPAVLPLSSTVELVALNRAKRPLVGYIDGDPQGPVDTMTARASNTATVELAFDPETNPAQKLASIQFPLQ